MIPIPGLLVEYLINGSIALLWLLPTLQLMGFAMQKDSSINLLLLPGLYMLGMIMDFLGWVILWPIKMLIEKNDLRKLEVDKKKLDPLEARSMVFTPDLTKEIDMRSSRYRIARGTFVNAIFATVAFVIYSYQMPTFLPSKTIVAVGLLIALVCLAVYVKFQDSSNKYEIQSLNALEEKLKYDKEKTRG